MIYTIRLEVTIEIWNDFYYCSCDFWFVIHEIRSKKNVFSYELNVCDIRRLPWWKIMNMHRFQEISKIESFFEKTISHTWDLLIFLKDLRSSTEEIFKWKLKNYSSKKKVANWTKLKYWMSLRRGIQQISVFQKWIECSWISNCNSLNDERSNISIVFCCTFHVELNHSFYQIQMIMKMIMNAFVENGLFFF